MTFARCPCLSFVQLVNYGGNPLLWKLPAPAPHAPSLTRYRKRRFTFGYFYDEYGLSGVDCCCYFADDGPFPTAGGALHIAPSLPSFVGLRCVCQFPAGINGRLRIFTVVP